LLASTFFDHPPLLIIYEEVHLGRALKIGIEKFTHRIYTQGKIFNWKFI